MSSCASCRPRRRSVRRNLRDLDARDPRKGADNAGQRLGPGHGRTLLVAGVQRGELLPLGGRSPARRVNLGTGVFALDLVVRQLDRPRPASATTRVRLGRLARLSRGRVRAELASRSVVPRRRPARLRAWRRGRGAGGRAVADERVQTASGGLPLGSGERDVPGRGRAALVGERGRRRGRGNGRALAGPCRPRSMAHLRRCVGFRPCGA